MRIPAPPSVTRNFRTVWSCWLASADSSVAAEASTSLRQTLDWQKIPGSPPRRHRVAKRIAKVLAMNARSIGFALFSLLFAAGAPDAAVTTQVLGIKLQDPSNDPSIAHMRIVLDRDTVKPGRITLTAENQSKGLVHEVLIARAADVENLPFDAKTDRVIEKRVRPLGEISDLAPGKAGKLTLTLKTGTYVLFCNQPGHYKDGMVAKLVVAP
jgi:uncharacterized cupredoxin-like copper-binding protein